MRNLQRLESDITYARDLVGAGLEGVTSALRRKGDGAAALPLSVAVFLSTAVGAIVGVWQASRSRSRVSRYSLALGGLAGSALGFGCGVAWESKGLAGTAARSAVHKVGSVRDARWLEKNPVAYG